MMKAFSGNKKFIPVAAVLIVLCFFIAFISYGNTVEAAQEPVWDNDSEIVIAHITDTHYYPLRYSYNGESEEFFSYMHQQFHKMWLESELVFNAALEKIKENKPDYLVFSGDIAQDGERQSHIDVANGLRRLQNEIRDIEGMEKFQIFVVFGNHDLYNDAVYNFSDGTKRKTWNVSRKDVAKIYASLGFPDLTEEEAASFYTQSELSSQGYSFVNSETADGIEIKWQFEPKKNQFDYEEGDLTYIAKTDKGLTVVGLDVVESNESEGHVLGATLTKETQQFLLDNKVHDDYCVGIAHHSIVPHMTMQKELLSGFIINDWINGADFLADYGMRYVFTGHMHSNDITHHISFNNNQITDLEAAANHSIESSVQYAKITNGVLGDKTVQNLTVWNDYLEELDISKAIDEGYITREYIERNHVEDFVDWEAKKITNYSAYARRRMYDNIIENILEAYVAPSVLDMLKDMIKGVLPDSFLNMPLDSLKTYIDKVLDVLVDEINEKVLADYEYSGDNPVYKENKLFGFAEELVNRLLEIEVAEDTYVFDFVMTCYLSHIYGNEPSSVEGLPQKIQDGLAYLQSGQFVKDAMDILLDKDRGLYFLIDKLATTPLDLSEAEEIKGLLELAMSLIGYKEDEPIANFIVGRVISSFLSSDLAARFGLQFDLEGKEVMEFLDDTIDGYLTESFYTGLGEIAANILISFATDSSPDADKDPKVVLLEKGDKYTYTSEGRQDVPTIQNGKLPAKLTVTFGEDPATDKNFTWFTDMRITDSVIQYMEKNENNFDPSKAVTVNGDTVIYGYTVGLIDLGLFAQLGYAEAARHTVELTGLKPGTEYLYRVGSAQYGYFSDVYTFKTAPSQNNAAFEVLLISDPQAFTNTAYEKIGEILSKMDKVFENGYDFVINTGDLVDNSKNVTQYDFYLNTLMGYWANTTHVVAVGNHGKYSFELKDDYNVSSDDVFVEEYNYMLMHFNFNLPEQDLSTGAYYSFDYSGVHFTVLNTNDIVDDKLSDAQIEWLIEDLSKTDKKHKVALMHKSLYSAGSHSYDKEIINMRAQLGPIFETNGVHLVLSGHDHTYNETYYLDGKGNIIKGVKNQTTKIGDKGTLFVNLGTIGNKFYKYVDNDKVPVYNGKQLHNPALSNPTFGKLVFDGDNLYYQGYQYNYQTGEFSAIDKPKEGLAGWEIALIVIGSVIGGGGMAVGAYFIVKTLKAKKASGSEISPQAEKAEAAQAEKPDTDKE